MFRKCLLSRKLHLVGGLLPQLDAWKVSYQDMLKLGTFSLVSVPVSNLTPKSRFLSVNFAT